MKEIGRIYGEVIGNQFTFSSREYYEKRFVCIEQKNVGLSLIGKITERKVMNKFLSSPEIIKYINESMDFQRDIIYTYDVTPVGTVCGDVLSQKFFSVLPGTPVYETDEKQLAAVYGISKTSIKVGYLKDAPACPVYLDTERIFQPHMTIIGRTGSGKSYFAKGLVRQLTEEKYYIFSPSDEYNHVVRGKSEKLYTEMILPLNTDSISYYLNLNMTEEVILNKIQFTDDKVYCVKDMISEIVMYYRENEQKKSRQMTLEFDSIRVPEVQLPQYAQSLIQKLKSIGNLKFSKKNSKLMQMKNSGVIDMSQYTQLEQECILNSCLYRIFQSCKRTQITNRKKHIIFIEEAHSFVPSVKNTLCKEIIVRLAREGRKFGISLCFITQRPRNFDQTSLSQSSNKVIFAVPHPDDVKRVLDDAVYFRPELGAVIQGQRQGQCVMIGDAFPCEIEIMVDFENGLC